MYSPQYDRLKDLITNWYTRFLNNDKQSNVDEYTNRKKKSNAIFLLKKYENIFPVAWSKLRKNINSCSHFGKVVFRTKCGTCRNDFSMTTHSQKLRSTPFER